MVLGVYEPLSLTLKASFVLLAGWDAGAFHTLAWALHGVNAALALVLGRRLLREFRGGEEGRGAAPGCVLGACLFACHPGSVQTVCWLSCLPYLFAAAFAQLSLLSLLRAQRRHMEGGHGALPGALLWRAGAALLYVGALWSKAAALPLAAALCLLDFVWVSRAAAPAGAGGGLLRALAALPKRAAAALLWQSAPLAIGVLSFEKAVGGYHLEELVVLSRAETMLRAGYVLVLYLFKVVDPWHDFNLMQGMPYDGIQGFLVECCACLAIAAAAMLYAAWALLTGPGACGARAAAGWLLACYAVMIAPGLGLHAHTSWCQAPTPDECSRAHTHIHNKPPK